MYKKINKNRFGVIEYAIDKEEDLDDIKIDNVDNTVYAIMNDSGKELIYLYSSYAKKWILINDVQEEINSINEQLDNKANVNEVIKKGYGTLNDFDEDTRAVLQGLEQGQINAVLGDGNVFLSNMETSLEEVLKSVAESTNRELKNLFDIVNGTFDLTSKETSLTISCTSKTVSYCPLFLDKYNGVDIKHFVFYPQVSSGTWIILGGDSSSFTICLGNNATGNKGIYEITGMTNGSKITDLVASQSFSKVEVEIRDDDIRFFINDSDEKIIPLSSFHSSNGVITRPRLGICFSELNKPCKIDLLANIDKTKLIPAQYNIPNKINILEEKIISNVLEISKIKNGGLEVQSKTLLDDLRNPFVKTKIKLIGDSITAGVGGSGYSPTGKTLYGSYKQVLPTGVCWGNMLKTTIEEQYNKYHYIPLTNNNITRTSITSEQISYDNNTKLGEKWRCENGGTDGKIAFSFYGNNFYIVHPKLSSGGILDIYIDGNKVGILDTYNTSFSWGNETQFNCETIGYHDVEIRETGIKNDSSTGRTIFLESIKIPKTAIVENYGISGIGTAEVISIKESLIEEDDDIVIVQLGTNDRFKTTCPEKSKYLLKEFIKYCEGLDKKVIQFCSLPASVSDEETRNWTIKDLDRIINDIALERKQDYLSQYKLFKKYCEEQGILIDEILADGLHPNDRGYKLMYINACIFLGISI